MQSITVNLPNHLYQRLTTAAQMSKKPLDTVVLQSIQAGLPPDLSHVPERFQTDLRQMDQMSDTLLRQLATDELTLDRSAQYEALLEKNQVETLSLPEQERLDMLREEADSLMFRRAYAAALLSWRVHAIPIPSQL